MVFFGAFPPEKCRLPHKRGQAGGCGAGAALILLTGKGVGGGGEVACCWLGNGGVTLLADALGLMSQEAWGIDAKAAQGLVEVGFNVHHDEEAGKLPVRRDPSDANTVCASTQPPAPAGRSSPTPSISPHHPMRIAIPVPPRRRRRGWLRRGGAALHCSPLRCIALHRTARMERAL